MRKLQTDCRPTRVQRKVKFRHFQNNPWAFDDTPNDQQRDCCVLCPMYIQEKSKTAYSLFYDALYPMRNERLVSSYSRQQNSEAHTRMRSSDIA